MISKKYAAIDIGSNAMRLLINNVIEYQGKKNYKKADIIRIPIRLGTEAFTVGKISDKTIEKFLFGMSGFANLMQAHEVVKFRACATSALREASNSDEIVKLVRAETGIDLEIISGKEEAEIIYSTHIGRIIDKNANFLYVDVGGGSVEISLFENGFLINSKSFNIGTLRILNNLVNERMWDDLKKWVKEVTQHKTLSLIGSGGNINKIFKISRKPQNETLSFDYLMGFHKKLKSYSYEERVVNFDLNTDRADVIIPALKIFVAIMGWSEATHIYVPKMGLADGLIKTME